MDTVPGVTKEHPLYFKLMSEPIKMDWKKIGVMLAITIISGYVASQSQRMGNALKMASNASWGVSNKAKRVAANIDKQYLKVTI